MISLRVYCVLVSLVMLLGKAGDLLGVALVDTAPMALLALNSNDLHCFLTGGGVRVASWAWFAITVTRRMAEDPLFYMLGYDHGEDGINYIAARLPAADRLTLLAKQASYASVFCDPGMFVCLIAGSTKMPLSHFFMLNFFGTVARLVLINLLASAFPDQVDYILGAVHAYQKYLLVGAVFVVSLSSWKLCFTTGEKKRDAKEKET